MLIYVYACIHTHTLLLMWVWKLQITNIMILGLSCLQVNSSLLYTLFHLVLQFGVFFSITIKYGSQIPLLFHFAVLWDDQDRRHWDWLSHDSSATLAAQSTFLAGLTSSGWNRLKPVFLYWLLSQKDRKSLHRKHF